MGVIQVTLTVLPDGFEIEPHDEIGKWMSPDSLADVIMGLNLNIPEGQYFAKVTVEVEPVPE